MSRKTWTRSLAFFLLSTFLALAGRPSEARISDPLDENYLTGYLTQEGSDRTLVWSTPPTGGTDPIPWPPTSGLAAGDATVRGQTSTVFKRTAVAVFPVATLEFRSEPFPTTLFLNVTRTAHLVLYLSDVGCNDNRITAEAFVDDARLFGAIGMLPANGDCVQDGYTNPPGYGTFKLYVYPELARIEKDAEIRIVLKKYTDDGRALNVGAGGIHASFVRFAFYPEEEVLYRKLATPSAGFDNGGPDLTLSAASPLCLLALAVAGLRRQPVPFLLAVLVLTAGCTSPGGVPVDPTEATHGTFEITHEPAGIKTGNGSVLGSVKDEQGYAVAGARVSLLPTEKFTDTTHAGRFRFDNVTPGAYTLRFEKAGFRTRQAALAVVADNVSIVEATLIRISSPGSTGPHTHPFWGGKPSVTMFDGDIGSITCDASAKCNSLRLLPRTGDTEDVPIVIPGTREVEMTLDWQKTDEVAGLRAKVTTNYDPINVTTLFARGPGQPYRFQSSWEMTDNGHQQFTTWDVIFTVDPIFAAGLFGRTTGPIHAKVVLHRGQLPIEHEHDDLWDNKMEYPVLITQQYQDSLGAQHAQGAQPSIAWAPKSKVPPEAVWLDVLLQQNRPTSPNEYTWDLRIKGATTPRTGADANSCSGLQGSWDARSIGSPQPANATKTAYRWRFKVEDTEADAFYATKSSWCFWTNVTNPLQEFVVDRYTGQQTQGQSLWLHLEVIAHRDPMPTS